ncbi:MAG: glycosyltransferase family 4 protein [Candidatus Magasanikbacteria bacterium]|nr:glycosyltransferase family 4 protein [Candidatus Magasanikbacteria bacterium]
MKIAMIGQKGLPAVWGGVERHVEELAIRLVKNGHQATVYSRSWYSQKRSKYQGVTLRFVPSIHTKNLDAITHTLFSTLDALRRDFDIIHYHGVGPALLSFIPRLLKPRAKVIVTFHCQDRLHGKWSLFAKIMLRLGEFAACKFPHETIVVSQTLQKYVKEKYDCEAIYLPNGITVATESNGQTLKKFGLKKDQYILAVSRLVSHKSIHYLIEAWRQLKKKQPTMTRDLKLAIVGDGFFTDHYVEYLRAMTRDLPNIIFTGWQKGAELSDLFSGSLFFVHPSQSEGLPLVVLEAMSYEKAVIVSDIPEHQEIIIDKRFLSEHNSVADLTRKLIWILQNPAIRKVSQIQNRQLVEKEYNWDMIMPLLEAVYQRAMCEDYQNLPMCKIKKILATA